MSRERVGIIGGGVFGLALANELASTHETVLFESQPTFGNATSSRNQARLQEGYLYAPNLATAQQCHEGAKRVRSHYPEAVLPQQSSHYLFVEQTNFSNIQFEEACSQLGLPLDEINMDRLVGKVHIDRVVAGYAVQEWNVDTEVLLHKLSQDAQRKGAVLLRKSPVKEINKTAYGTVNVTTPQETVAVDTVINASGPWVSHVARLAGHDLPVTLEKATFYLAHNANFEDSYTFVFSREYGGTVIPHAAMGGVVLGHGEVNVQTTDPEDYVEIDGGDIKTLNHLQQLTPLLQEVTLDSLSPITGVKVKADSSSLRESSLIKHEDGVYSVIGGKLTASLYVAEQVREEIENQ